MTHGNGTSVTSPRTLEAPETEGWGERGSRHSCIGSGSLTRGEGEKNCALQGSPTITCACFVASWRRGGTWRRWAWFLVFCSPLSLSLALLFVPLCHAHTYTRTHTHDTTPPPNMASNCGIQSTQADLKLAKMQLSGFETILILEDKRTHKLFERYTAPNSLSHEPKDSDGEHLGGVPPHDAPLWQGVKAAFNSANALDYALYKEGGRQALKLVGRMNKARSKREEEKKDLGKKIGHEKSRGKTQRAVARLTMETLKNQRRLGGGKVRKIHNFSPRQSPTSGSS